MKLKCINCGEMFEDKLIDEMNINKIERIWCNECVTKFWEKRNEKHTNKNKSE